MSNVTPKRARRLWSEVPLEESAVALMLDRYEGWHRKFKQRRTRQHLLRFRNRLSNPEGCCQAAQPFPWSSRPYDPPEGWIPCVQRPNAGETFCWSHGGRSRAQIERSRALPKPPAENRVDIEIRVPEITLAKLAQVAGLIERHAAAANAPTWATVRFEDSLVRARGDENMNVVHVTWHIDGMDE